MNLAAFTAVADLGDHIHPTVRQRLTAVSIPKWIRLTAMLWLWVILVTIVFLGIAVAIHYGPF